MFGFDLKADYVAKFADLEELLKSPCIVSLENGSSLNNKDILEIAGRTKIMGAKSMDALMHYASVPYHKQSHCTVDKKIQFFDTKFTSLLMKHFTKFSRIAAKDKENFVFQENLMEYFVNDGGRNGIGERFYFPFNLDKQHWVGVCVDINQKAVFVLDCNLSFRTDSLIKKDLLPVAQMVPYVMKGVMKERKLFSLERVCGIPHNGIHSDSAVTVILLIQTHAHGGVEKCKSITTRVVGLESKKLVVVLYDLCVIFMSYL